MQVEAAAWMLEMTAGALGAASAAGSVKALHDLSDWRECQIRRDDQATLDTAPSLKKRGIPRNVMSLASFGEEQPLVPTEDGEREV